MTALRDLTTLRVGGPVAQLIETTTEADFIAAVRSADRAGQPVLVLGGGSNILAADEPFDGVVVRDRRQGLYIADDACAGVTVTVPAGHIWDDVVARAVTEGWVGVEALSGIPGSTGATPVQNVGAYGQEVSETLTAVRVWDRKENRVRTLPRPRLAFGYRASKLKRTLSQGWGPTPRFVVLDVTFSFRHGELSSPIRFGELARTLDVAEEGRAPLGEVRKAVLALRAAKGMVLDPADHDTWSAGSFFTNPVLSVDSAAALPPDAPRYPADDGLVKTSAAWLIEHAGFGKGYGLPGPATLSTKHALALTNRGAASAEDLLTLARTVRDGVRSCFGVELVPEPVLVGVEL